MDSTAASESVDSEASLHATTEGSLASSDAGDASSSDFSSTLATLTLHSGIQEPTSVSSSQVPSLQSKAQVDEVKKQLFPGMATPVSEPLLGSSKTGSVAEGSPAATAQQAETHSGSSSSAGRGVSVIDLSTPPSALTSAPTPQSTGVESPRQLKLIIDSSKVTAAAAEAMTDPTALASIGMSPGARSFAPPFGAKFGDRNNPKAGAGLKEMELVHEGEEDEAVAAGHSEESLPTGAGAPASPASTATPSVGTSSPAAPSSPAAVASTKHVTEDHRNPTDAGTSLSNTDAAHAPRVASSSLQAGGSAAGEPSTRPRFRMAFEGRRDEDVMAPTDSKFAPTPRVKPKDGLPWAR